MSHPPWPAPGRPNDWSGRDFPPRLPPTGPPPVWGGPPPGGFPPPPSPPRKPFYQRAWFIVLVALVGLSVLSNLVDDRHDSNEATLGDYSSTLGDDLTEKPEPTPTPAPTPTPTPEPTPGIGQPAADGDFSFVVTGVECGATTIGGAYV